MGIVALAIDRDICKNGSTDSPLWIFCVCSMFGPPIAYGCTNFFPVKSQSKLLFDQKLSTKMDRARLEEQAEMEYNNNFNMIAQEVVLSFYGAMYFIVSTLFLAGTIDVCGELKERTLWVWFIITYILCCAYLLYRLLQLSRILIAICFHDYFESITKTDRHVPITPGHDEDDDQTSYEDDREGVIIQGDISFTIPNGDDIDSNGADDEFQREELERILPAQPRRRASLLGADYMSVHSVDV